MPDWTAYVRAHLALPSLTPAREAHIVREIAAQLEDFYRDALARGASDAEAEAWAASQIRDWDAMARDVAAADRRHARPRAERIAAGIEDRSPRPGGLAMFAQLITDMRYGLRQMRRAPGFSALAVITLAFGVGAATAISSVVNAVMMKPLPYPDQDRVVMVFEVLPAYGRFSVAPGNFLDWRAENRVFERLAAVGTGYEVVTGDGDPERLLRAIVSGDVFDLLGVAPAVGRGFLPEEDQPGRNGVVVLSHGLWSRRYGRDPGIVGRAIILNGEPATVVGVMPPTFYFPNRTVEFWRPIALPATGATRGGHYLTAVGRLKAGVSLEQARAEMRAIAARLAQQYPDSNRDESAEVVEMREFIVGRVRPMLMILLAAVAVVLLIVCANVANLLLVRGSAREREIAIRAALGAGRRRLAGQMLAEGLVLAAGGGALGVLLAYLAMAPMRAFSAGTIPRATEIAIDGGVLAVALLVTIVTGLLFSLAPAWHAWRGDSGVVLREGTRASGARGHRLRNGLLVAEVAMSIVLLVGAALLLRSFARLTAVDPGFRADNVLAFSVGLPPAAYPEDEHRRMLFERLLERLRGMPGVEAAGMVQTIPIRNDYMLSFTIQGRPPNPPGNDPSANYRVASPGYFEALSIPLHRGRLFAEADSATAPLVAVVDEAFARRHFPGEDPIGQRLDIGNGTDGFFEIVGVVGSVRHEGLDADPRPTMYVAFRQNVFASMWVMVRTTGDPAAFAPTARQALREVDPALPAASLAPLATVITESVAQRRFSMLLLTLFASVTLFLAAVGLYGVIAYVVSQRTREIGVRMAIGAQRADVMRMVLGRGLALAALGVGVGLGAAFALTRYIAAMLFEIAPFDAVSYGASAALLLAVSLLACYVPARRASTVDPLVALRAE